jgi:hypothetical protein
MSKAEELLEAARCLQHSFWDALGGLEAELDIEIDGTQDLDGLTVDDLKAECAGTEL